MIESSTGPGCECHSNHPAIGFWEAPGRLAAAEIGRLVDAGWAARDGEERDTVLRYLRAGACLGEGHQYKGFARCRLCKQALGSHDMVTPDGKWLFPEGHEHYITEHGVRPRDDFVLAAVAWTR